MISALRRAGWWALDYGYAAVWQIRATFSPAAAVDLRSGALAPVVVVPGVYESWKFMQPLATAIHDRGHPVHVVETLRHGRRPIEEMALQISDYLESRDLTDVIIVAHSKGGLAGKLVMVGPASRRVAAMLAIATPFGGSRYARLMPVRTLREFAPRHRSIVEVARHLSVNERIVSVYPAFDPHIPGGSSLQGAKNVRLDTGGHFRILAHPRVIGELAALAGAVDHAP